MGLKLPGNPCPVQQKGRAVTGVTEPLLGMSQLFRKLRQIRVSGRARYPRHDLVLSYAGTRSEGKEGLRDIQSGANLIL